MKGSPGFHRARKGGDDSALMHMTAIDEIVLERATDEELVSRSQTDFEAATELYNRYICPIYRFVRSQTPNDQIAEDLTAHIFFKAFSYSSSFKADGSYRAWIYRIARNCISSWRRSSERATIVIDEMPESVDTEPSPATRAISNQERSFIWRTVAKLPPAQREVVALHYLEDLSIGEISQVTKRSNGAIRVLLHRARTKLRGVLDRGEVR